MVSLANELIKDNIRVNTINPGLVLTPDWIKTAKQLTADKGGDWQAHLDGVARERTDQRQYPREHDQSGSGADSGLDQDRQTVNRRQRRGLASPSRWCRSRTN